MTNWTRMGVTIASALVAGFAYAPPPADGAERRVHATACMPERDDHGAWNYRNGDFLSFTFTQLNKVVRCPAPSDTKFHHRNATVLNVHGQNGAGHSSKACVVDWASATTSCGNAKPWGSGFTGALGVDLSQWQGHDEWWYPYVHHAMSSQGALYGFYIGN